MPSQPSRIFVRQLSYFHERAEGLVAVVADGLPQALEQVRRWHPEHHNKTDDAILRAKFSLADAQLVYAQQHGFSTWTDLAHYLDKLPAVAENEPFLTVFEAAHNGDWPLVLSTLQAHPDVVQQHGTNGNTLLNLAASLLACPTADQARSGKSAPERLDPMRLLLQSGGDANAANDRGWTPLHQAAYRNDPEMVSLLLTNGAQPGAVAYGSGGTPLAVALFWGHRDAAATLAEVAIVPNNLRVAAALGRDDLVRACFTKQRTLFEHAGADRGFYRPHRGFPPWQPSNTQQEIVDEALVWAAKSGHTDAMDTLLTHGANVDAEPYRGTPLVWAAACDRTDAITWLLSHGADINKRASFGGLSHGAGVTALHLAAQGNNVNAIRLLLQHGADPSITDNLYGGTPRRWAEHEGADDALAILTEQ